MKTKKSQRKRFYPKIALRHFYYNILFFHVIHEWNAQTSDQIAKVIFYVVTLFIDETVSG